MITTSDLNYPDTVLPCRTVIWKICYTKKRLIKSVFLFLYGKTD